MLNIATTRPTSIATRIVFWPCLVDMLTSVLMIFLLVYFIQATLGQKDLEAQLIRRNQERFVADFREDFATEIQDQTVAVKQDLNLVQLTFSDRILFPPREYQLQPAGKSALKRCATLFNRSARSGFKQIQVEGHTDTDRLSSGSYPRDNWDLSTGRAISVVKFLIENGVKENLLSANGYAATKPVDQRETAEAFAKNRRIEIRIIFSTPERR